MEKTEKLQPRSFRLTDETTNRFKEIAESLGGNQQQTLAKLIETFELQAGKSALVDKQDDIDRFEGYSMAITRMYMEALEASRDSMVTARSEVEGLLKSKDKVIQELQEEIEKNKEVVKEAFEKEKQYKARLIDVEDELKKVKESTEQELFKKERELSIANEQLKAVRASVDSISAVASELKDQTIKVSDERDALKVRLQEASELAKSSHGQLEASETLVEKLKADLHVKEQYIESLKSTVDDKVESMKVMLEEKKELEIGQAVLREQQKMREEYEKEIRRFKEEADKYRELYYELKESHSNKEN